MVSRQGDKGEHIRTRAGPPKGGRGSKISAYARSLMMCPHSAMIAAPLRIASASGSDGSTPKASSSWGPCIQSAARRVDSSSNAGRHCDIGHVGRQWMLTCILVQHGGILYAPCMEDERLVGAAPTLASAHTEIR